MANSDKNILITPNTNQSDQPKIEFVGSGSNAITLKVLDDNSLSWEGSEGQLFSITPVLSTGSIFSVNDISGIPSIEVNADGTVSLAEFSGNVGVGTASPTHKLTVNGTVSGSTGLFTTITASSIQGTVAGGVTTTNISSYATTGVTAGTGLSGGGTVGTLTLNLDFSELTDKTSDIAGTTEFILQDGTTESRKAASEIKLSFFNNDSGWTSNAGTVTSIATNNGITGGTITSTGTVGLTGQALALHNLSTNGLIVRTGAGTVAGRTITAGTGITVTNGNGVSSNPSIALTSDSLTVGSTSISLGGTATTIAGLSSVTSTGFTGSLDGNAATANTATNATNVATTQELTTNAQRFIPFVDDYTTTNQSLKVDGGLSYNPSNNSLTASVFVGSLQGSVEGTAFRETGVGMRITNPEGATFHQGSSGTSGSIAIQFPSALGAFMASIRIRVFDHFAQGSTESYDVICGGYHGGSSWGTHHAYIIGAPGTDSDYPIRFANSGSSAYIIIGDPDEPVRDYLNVAVTEVNVGGYNLAAQSTWSTGWDIRIVPDNLNEFSVQYTENSNQIGASTSITTDNSTNNSGYIPMSLGTATGATSLTVDTAFYFNPGTNTLTSPTFAGNLAWSYITGTPTTVSGYGITDAVSLSATNTFTAQNTFNNYDLTVNDLTIGRRNASSNVIMGQYAGNASQTGTNNIFIGRYAASNNSSGGSNVVIGGEAGDITTGTNNVAIGYRSLNGSVTNSYNTGLGAYTLYNLTSGQYNLAMGYNAMGSGIVTGQDNVAAGRNALYSLTSARNNVGIGYYALFANQTGWNNVAVGYQAGDSITSGGTNTFLGYNAGSSVTTGQYNVILGGYVGTSALSNNIVLSDGQAQVRMLIDSSGFVGINETTPGYQLHVSDNRNLNYVGYFENTNNGGDGIRIYAGETTDSSTKNLIEFRTHGGTLLGGISYTTTTTLTYGTFTGAHESTTVSSSLTEMPYGAIVKVTDSYLSGSDEMGQPIYECALTQAEKEKGVIGVYGGVHTKNNTHNILSLGDGQILVCSEGGNIEIGDYICSSNTEGAGMKQDDDFLHNYTVAKATEAVDWSAENVTSKLINCTYHCG